jgi:hypothetical protein
VVAIKNGSTACRSLESTTPPARSKIMVAVGLVTDCSEPAATKNAVGHGISSLPTSDRVVAGPSAPWCNVDLRLRHSRMWTDVRTGDAVTAA